MRSGVAGPWWSAYLVDPEIEFQSEGHIYAWRGRRVPLSVSKIAKDPADYAGVPRHILRRAARRGSAVHEIVETTVAGRPLDEHYQRAASMLKDGWLEAALEAAEIMASLGVVVYASELPMVSTDPEIHVGMGDLICTVGGNAIPVVLDVKSTAQRWMESHRVQLWGYRSLVASTIRRLSGTPVARVDGLVLYVKAGRRPELRREVNETWARMEWVRRFEAATGGGGSRSEGRPDLSGAGRTSTGWSGE